MVLINVNYSITTMSYEKAKALLAKYKDGTATDDEKALVEKWLFRLNDEPVDLSDDQIDKISQEIWAKLPQPGIAHTRHLRVFTRIAAAASIILAVSAGLYFFRSAKPATKKPQYANDIPPGDNKLILRLSNGKNIDLTAAKNGQIAKQGQTAITKVSNGQITYSAAAAGSLPIAYNTVTAPRGGQGGITLSDGTKVWLNAASSITFPTAFNADNRTVTITGEVYFEVVHDTKRPPLRIIANNQIVEDIGTKFNINAYPDEPDMKTSLLEGSIEISAGNEHSILEPGQQARIGQNKFNVVRDADLEEATAWHKGLFQFHDASIQTVMRQLARWYDVDISYEGKIPDRLFSGKIYRNATALTVADILSYKKIHFKIEGKRIIVEP
jgi:transmembrane sensor